MLNASADAEKLDYLYIVGGNVKRYRAMENNFPTGG
jgi:hypothetical protein